MGPRAASSPGIVIRVPATSANLGPGFDGLGIAVNLHNEFRVRILPEGPDLIRGKGTCKDLAAGSENIFFKSAGRIFDYCEVAPVPMSVEVLGGVPVARGLGSSATAVVAGVLAANLIAGIKLGTTKAPLSPLDALLHMAREEGHPDNVAPALLGGLVAAVDTPNRIIVSREHPHRGWRIAVFVPDYHLSTEKARAAIPNTIPHKDAVFNLTRAKLVFDCIAAGHRAELGLVMEDRLHEPYRKHLIKGYDELRAAALEAGASGVYLSGAGPAFAAFAWGDDASRAVCKAMASTARRCGVKGTALQLRPELKGTVISNLKSR